MGIISGGGGGGLPLTGGTITGPLVVDARLVSGGVKVIRVRLPFSEEVFITADSNSLAFADDAGGAVLNVSDSSVVLGNSTYISAGFQLTGANVSALLPNTGKFKVIDQGSADSIFEVPHAGGILTVPPAPATVALVSGTGAQISTARDTETVTPFTGDGTNNVASCLVQISRDNLTYTTLDTLSIAAAINLTGVLALAANVSVPGGWYIKLTASHGTLGTTTYY